MTSKPLGGPRFPRRLPGEDDRLWHLEPRAQPFEYRPTAERLRIVTEEAWVEPPSSRQLRERMFLNFGLDDRLTPGRGAFVTGGAGAGTPSFLDVMAREHREGYGKRVASAAMPVRLEVLDLLIELRRAVGDHSYQGERTDELELRLYDDVAQANVCAIAVDDMEHLLHVSPRRREIMLFWLRHVAARARVHMVLSTPPRLFEEMDRYYNGPIAAKDQHEIIRLTRPFQEYRLAPFQIDAEYVDLLDLWERSLPLLQASNLAGRELALHLYSLCDGKPGRLASVLRKAAANAIVGGTERITSELLDHMGFHPPSTFDEFRF